jgi:hypothetical protein
MVSKNTKKLLIVFFVLAVIGVTVFLVMKKKDKKDNFNSKLKMNNPEEIKKLALKHCKQSTPELINGFLRVMEMENRCQSSLWDDGDGPGNTDDDNVMMTLCGHPALEPYKDKYDSQFKSIFCALNPDNNISSCC